MAREVWMRDSIVLRAAECAVVRAARFLSRVSWAWEQGVNWVCSMDGEREGGCDGVKDTLRRRTRAALASLRRLL